MEHGLVRSPHRTRSLRRKCQKPKVKSSPQKMLLLQNSTAAGRATGKPGEKWKKSGFDVLDRSGYQVAHWFRLVEPDDHGKILNHLGGYDNNALIEVERNNQGLTTITKLKDLKYANRYMEATVDQRTQKST